MTAGVTGFVVFAHGSAVESANAAVRVVAAEFARAGGYTLVETAFLELAQPDLPAAVARLVSAGATRIVVLPYFLTLGTHLQRDLPRIVDSIASRHAALRIETTAPLDGHPGLLTALLDRAGKAVAP